MMEYLNFWSGFGLGLLCFISLGYAIYKDAENKADKIIEDIYQNIEVNEKPEIKLVTWHLGYSGSEGKVYRCYFCELYGYGKTPLEAYQNYKSMCYNKGTD